MKTIWVGVMIGVAALAGLAGWSASRPAPIVAIPGKPFVPDFREAAKPHNAPSGPALGAWKEIWAANTPMPELVAKAPPPPQDLLLQPPPPVPVHPVAPPPVANSLENKLEQMLHKLEQIEKRLDALQERKEEKLIREADKMLERIEELEKKLESQGEQETAAPGLPRLGGAWVNALLWAVPWVWENCPFYWSPPGVAGEERIRRLLVDSENLRKIQEEVDKYWMGSEPASEEPEKKAQTRGKQETAALELPRSNLTLAKAIEKTQSDKKIVMVNFYADWCGPCKQLNTKTLSDEKVQKFLKDKTVAIKVNIDDNKKLSQKYRIIGIPCMVFIDGEGKEVGRVLGYRDAEKFLEEANNLLTPKCGAAQNSKPAENEPDADEVRIRFSSGPPGYTSSPIGCPPDLASDWDQFWFGEFPRKLTPFRVNGVVGP